MLIGVYNLNEHRLSPFLRLVALFLCDKYQTVCSQVESIDRVLQRNFLLTIAERFLSDIILSCQKNGMDYGWEKLLKLVVTML